MSAKLDRVRARWYAERVAQQICGRTNYTLRELLGRRRYASLTLARRLAYWLVRELSGASWPAIGQAFDRSHDTCLRGARSFAEELAHNRQARALLATVIEPQ